MFEFMKIINETRYRSKAFEQLWKQFPELEEIDPNPFEGPWEIRCFQEATKPYVMVKHVIVNNTMVRIEWYEYYKNCLLYTSFHQYCAKGGKPPICTKAQPWQEFNTGKTPQIASEIEPEFRALISDMLECELSKRPAMAEVHKRLLQIDVYKRQA